MILEIEGPTVHQLHHNSFTKLITEKNHDKYLYRQAVCYTQKIEIEGCFIPIKIEAECRKSGIALDRPLRVIDQQPFQER